MFTVPLCVAVLMILIPLLLGLKWRAPKELLILLLLGFFSGVMLTRYDYIPAREVKQTDPEEIYHPYTIKQIVEREGFIQMLVLENPAGERYQLRLAGYRPVPELEKSIQVSETGRTIYQGHKSLFAPEFFIPIASLMTDPTSTPVPASP